MEQYDKLILRATHLDGFICNKNTEVYFWKYYKVGDEDWIVATLDNPDKKAYITFHISNVEKAYNHLTNEIIYEKDPRTNL